MDRTLIHDLPDHLGQTVTVCGWVNVDERSGPEHRLDWRPLDVRLPRPGDSLIPA